MFKTDRPSEEDNGTTARPSVPKHHLRSSGKTQFRNEQEFSAWIDQELDMLEALYAEYATNDSLRGYFSR